MRAVAPPEAIRTEYAAWTWSVAWSYEGAVTAWRLQSRSGAVRYLKVRACEEEPRLGAEAARLAWARHRVAVPDVVAHGSAGDVDWLVVEGLPGRDATDPALKAAPAGLVTSLAQGLRRLHETPIDGCPFRLSTEDAIAAVRRRVATGQAEHADLHPEYSHLTLDDAVEEIERLAPPTEDLVLCHGDYCFPNVLIEDGRVTAYLDLGELAVADRWWDVAVGSWSTSWNVGPGWEQLFLDGYGIEPDPDRITFYRLVYDLIS